MSEIPTNRLRAYNVALASFTHWVHNLAVSKATPVMLNTTPYGAYFIFGSLNLTAAILAWWIPETKGVSSKNPFCVAHDMCILGQQLTTARSPSNVWTNSLVFQTSPTSRMWVLQPSKREVNRIIWKPRTCTYQRFSSRSKYPPNLPRIRACRC